MGSPLTSGRPAVWGRCSRPGPIVSTAERTASNVARRRRRSTSPSCRTRSTGSRAGARGAPYTKNDRIATPRHGLYRSRAGIGRSRARLAGEPGRRSTCHAVGRLVVPLSDGLHGRHAEGRIAAAMRRRHRAHDVSTECASFRDRSVADRVWWDFRGPLGSTTGAPNSARLLLMSADERQWASTCCNGSDDERRGRPAQGNRCRLPRNAARNIEPDPRRELNVLLDAA